MRAPLPGGEVSWRLAGRDWLDARRTLKARRDAIALLIEGAMIEELTPVERKRLRITAGFVATEVAKVQCRVSGWQSPDWAPKTAIPKRIKALRRLAAIAPATAQPQRISNVANFDQDWLAHMGAPPPGIVRRFAVEKAAQLIEAWIGRGALTWYQHGLLAHVARALAGKPRMYLRRQERLHL